MEEGGRIGVILSQSGSWHPWKRTKWRRLRRQRPHNFHSLVLSANVYSLSCMHAVKCKQ